MCIPKWKAHVTVTINPQVLAFGQKPSRKTVPGYSVGEKPDFPAGGLESGGRTHVDFITLALPNLFR